MASSRFMLMIPLRPIVQPAEPISTHLQSAKQMASGSLRAVRFIPLNPCCSKHIPLTNDISLKQVLILFSSIINKKTGDFGSKDLTHGTGDATGSRTE